jgi:thiosulfate dehydrogenase
LRQHLRGALVGIVVFLGVATGFATACVYLGFAPMAADSMPSSLEETLAMRAVHAASEREMGERKNPLAVSGANLRAGLIVYRNNCLMCHGAADGKRSIIANGFYVRAPQFATDGAEDDPEGATYWKIHHGIRFTAMPAFRNGLTDTQIWQVTMFIKRMDRLPKDVDLAWKSAKSVGVAKASSQTPMGMRM